MIVLARWILFFALVYGYYFAVQWEIFLAFKTGWVLVTALMLISVWPLVNIFALTLVFWAVPYGQRFFAWLLFVVATPVLWIVYLVGIWHQLPRNVFIAQAILMFWTLLISGKVTFSLERNTAQMLADSEQPN
ncbi:MAG: hypothetical protein ACRCXD_08740 [Luteolibacter sp.]